jgi:hypothetical protein
MNKRFFGNPDLLHNNDSKPDDRNEKEIPSNDPYAVQKSLEESENFYQLMEQYSSQDKKTWDDCLIAGAKLVLYFEAQHTNHITGDRLNRLGKKLGPKNRNNMEKILQLADEEKIILDSTTDINRAAIAYYEDQKNINPKSQPYIHLLSSFYPDHYKPKSKHFSQNA